MQRAEAADELPYNAQGETQFPPAGVWSLHEVTLRVASVIAVLSRVLFGHKRLLESSNIDLVPDP